MKVRVKFSKQGNMKFIGHLDVMRYFQKAIRRAGIDIAYTEGLSPHMIMSFASPLGVGLTSGAEYMDIELRSPLSSREAIDALNRAGADGIRVTGFWQIPKGKASSAMTLVAAADYLVRFRKGCGPEEGLRRGECGENAAQAGNAAAPIPAESTPAAWPGLPLAVSEFCAQERIPVWKETKKSAKEVDIRPMIYEMRCVPQDIQADGADSPAASGDCAFRAVQAGAEPSAAPEDGSLRAEGGTDAAVFMKLASGSAANLKPELVMESLLAKYGIAPGPHALEIHRCELYANIGDEGARRLVPLAQLGTEIV